MKQEKFDWGYFLKHIAIIAVPVALQNLLTTTGSMVDTIMLASIGEKAVGAIGLCAQFSSLMFSGYWGFIGGGMLWGEAYDYAMCILEEMQWIRTKSIHVCEYFHGTLELVEKDTSLILFYGEDETRPLMDRVLKFSKTVSDEITIFDTKEVELPFTDPEFRKIVSPIVIYAITERLSAHLAKERNHPLTTRRYYRQMEY